MNMPPHSQKGDLYTLNISPMSAILAGTLLFLGHHILSCWHNEPDWPIFFLATRNHVAWKDEMGNWFHEITL